jgi:F420-dependent oxidoreductase-like protein
MRVSVNVTNYSWPGGSASLRTELAAVARDADDAGLDTLWVSDHLIQADPTSRPSDTEMLEAYTTLGYLAAVTQRIRLGTMVSAVTYRHLAVLVKAVTTLDVLSGGRAWFGVGAGYLEREAHEMGLVLPPIAERFDWLDDALRLATQMWAGDESAFAGHRAVLARPVNSPQSVRRPRPPILVGGTGERRTLPLVAKYADACNLFDIPDGGATVSKKLAVLRDCCEDVGRPYDEIDKTLSTRLAHDDSPAAFAERCERVSRLGIDHVVVLTAGPWTPASVATLGEAAQLLTAS